jgi:hypothetical protein
VSYERIDPIERSSGVDRTTRVVPLHHVGRREAPPDEQSQQHRRRGQREQPADDDGRPHVDVLA